MNAPASQTWTLLVYRIPAQPSKLRLSIWRRLQRMGVVYLQDAVCLLPTRPDLDENMQYVAESIAEMGGTCHLFSAIALLPGGTERLVGEFRAAAEARMTEIGLGLDGVKTTAVSAPSDVARIADAEGALKRERVAFLHAKRLAYFGSAKEQEIDARLDSLRLALNDLERSVK